MVLECTQAQGQRYQNGSKFWDKDGKSGHPCAPSSTPWCTIVCLLVHICTPLCAICILKYTLADPLLHPDVQLCTFWYTFVHPYAHSVYSSTPLRTLCYTLMYSCVPSCTHLYTLMHPCELSDTPWRTLAQLYTPVHSRLTCQTFGRICKFLNTLLCSAPM